MPVNQKEPIFQ